MTRALELLDRAEPAPRPVLQRRCSCGGIVTSGGECAACRARRLRRQSGPPLAPRIVHDVVRSAGRPLESGIRGEMEVRLGHDFSRVRVHTDARAADSARAVGALAYAVGNDVVFDSGRYAPASAEGKAVLSHELTHVIQQGDLTYHSGPLPIGRPDDPAERQAEQVATGGSRARGSTTSAAPVLRRLGANPGCTDAQARDIHQAIFNARGWLNKAIPQLEASPLSGRALGSLRGNFGPTYGVAANASLIVGRLRAAYRELSTIPIGCAAAPDATCAAGHCGYATAGGHAATICTDVTLATADAVFRAGCVLHESLHAAFSRFTIDEYSGWHGRSGSTATYPGAGTDPLLNADSYTSLVMDLS
jgi:hypothetical protein